MIVRNNLLKRFTLLAIISAALCLLSAMAAKKPTDLPAPDATIFLTGNELGELKPCGCSGGQLGGLDRRKAVLDTAPAEKRLILDTGNLLKNRDQQAMIKFDILMQAYQLLDYDMLRFTADDGDMAMQAGTDPENLKFTVINAADPVLGNTFSKSIPTDQGELTINIADFNADIQQIDNIANLFEPAPLTYNILIVNNCPDNLAQQILTDYPVDCLICPAVYDEPAVEPGPGNSLFITVGKFGKYVARLDLRTSPSRKKPRVDFAVDAVTEDLPVNPQLAQLYKYYQQLLKDADLLEQHPRFSLPGKLRYLGNDSCKMCHQYEYDKWSTKEHAHAWETLVKVGSQYDPECVVCHVVGMDYESGFVNEDSPDDLRDVGCENCHGPGSEHVKTFGKTPPGQPKMSCLTCHTPENSANYASNELEYYNKIIHWREPNSPADVKE